MNPGYFQTFQHFFIKIVQYYKIYVDHDNAAKLLMENIQKYRN